MKRTLCKIEDVASWHDLHLAFYKAAKGKKTKRNVQEYQRNLNENLLQLQQQLLDHIPLQIGNYYYFTITDPKERTICAASFPERVMHHALMNVCHAAFEKNLIAHTYATRPQKGTYAAIATARTYYVKYRWVAKLDVRKYFDSIDHKQLNDALKRIVAGQRVLHIFNLLIESYQTQSGKGLPIGNLTSQYFANLYLSAADHFALEELRPVAYVRYMDDMLLFADDYNHLRNAVIRFSIFLEQKRSLNLKPYLLKRTSYALSFLGYVILPHQLRANRRSKHRFRQKLIANTKGYNSGALSQLEYRDRLQALFSFMLKANTFYYRKQALSLLLGNGR